MDWLEALTEVVSNNQLVVFRFAAAEWADIAYSPRSMTGIRPFTFARYHSLLNDFSVPTVGLLFGEGPVGTEGFICSVNSKRAVTTLQSMVSISSVSPIFVDTEQELLKIVNKRGFKTKFRNRLKLRDSVISIGPKLGAHVIERLAANESNHEAMRVVYSALNAPKTFASNIALQQDAVNLALKTFGLSAKDTTILVETRENSETSLSRVDAMEFNYERPYTRIHEDAVIEHDARNVPGFTFIESDLTGRAIFEKGHEQLEIITANRRPLESVFGVDLIYLNAMRKNVVMVQYKMLEPRRKSNKTDWIFWPNEQFEREIDRMKRFGCSHSPGAMEYRINPQVFYLRFVRRDAVLGKVTATMPLDHFEVLRKNPECRGPQGSFRISYNTLDGRYLRQNAFTELLRTGYIGAHAKTTADLETLIRGILDDDRAVIGALHSTRITES